MIESFSELQMSQRQIIVRRCPFGPHNCGGGACGRQKWRTGWSSDYPMIERITKFIAILHLRENGLHNLNHVDANKSEFLSEDAIELPRFQCRDKPTFRGRSRMPLEINVMQSSWAQRQHKATIAANQNLSRPYQNRPIVVPRHIAISFASHATKIGRINFANQNQLRLHRLQNGWTLF